MNRAAFGSRSRKDYAPTFKDLIEKVKFMKSLFIVLSVATLFCAPAFAKGGGGHSGGSHSGGTHSSLSASHSVKGYVKKNGTYVAPSHATNPNKSKSDNWSTKGNTNPYTGKAGSKDPVPGK